MEKVVFSLFIAAVAILAKDDIDEIVNKIKSQRESKISKSELKKLSSPIPKIIIVEDKNSSKKDGNKTKIIAKEQEEVFNLSAIMNNSAFINGKWVREGEKIGSYKVVEIMDDAVVLKDNKRTKLIFFKKNSGKIKIIGGR